MGTDTASTTATTTTWMGKRTETKNNFMAKNNNGCAPLRCRRSATYVPVNENRLINFPSNQTKIEYERGERQCMANGKLGTQTNTFDFDLIIRMVRPMSVYKTNEQQVNARDQMMPAQHRVPNCSRFAVQNVFLYVFIFDLTSWRCRCHIFSPLFLWAKRSLEFVLHLDSLRLPFGQRTAINSQIIIIIHVILN